MTLLDAPTITDPELADILDVTRREFLGGTVAAGALAVLAATGVGGVADAATGWGYTDDRGTSVHLASRPKRIAFLTDSVGAALWSAGLRPVAATNSHQGIVQAVGMNFAHVTNIGPGAPTINLEAVAAAKPDLMVDAVQPDGTLQSESGNPKLSAIAPVVGINTYAAIEQIIAAADRLTTAVGTARTDRSDQARYEKSSANLARAIKANPRLRVAFVFDISGTQLGVMNPKTWSILKTARALGMDLVPVAAGSANTYSQEYSYELAASIPADFVVWAVADPLPTSPGWKAIPAVKAGQWWKPELASWYAYTWANFATLLDGLATHVTKAKPGIGPR